MKVSLNVDSKRTPNNLFIAAGGFQLLSNNLGLCPFAILNASVSHPPHSCGRRAGVVAKSMDIKTMIDFGTSAAAARGEGFGALLDSSADWMWDMQAPEEQLQLQLQLEELQERAELLSDDPPPNMMDDDFDNVSGSALGGVYWEMLMPKARRPKDSGQESRGSRDEDSSSESAWRRVSGAVVRAGGATRSAWDQRGSSMDAALAAWDSSSLDEGDRAEREGNREQ